MPMLRSRSAGLPLLRFQQLIKPCALYGITQQVIGLGDQDEPFMRIRKFTYVRVVQLGLGAVCIADRR